MSLPLSWAHATGRHMKAALPFVIEATMAVLSGRAAWILLSNQAYFDDSPANYAWLVAHITSHEWAMGSLAMVASSFKMIGLFGLRARADWAVDLVFAARQFGWTASCIFWGLIGTSILVGAPNTLGSGNTITLSILAATIMVSGPAMPGDRHDG